MEETTYNDWDSVRLDIAISTKAGEGTKEFVTDTVYFTITLIWINLIRILKGANHNTQPPRQACRNN